MAPVNSELPAKPTRAHRCRHHPRITAKCDSCNAWGRYQAALRRYAIATGTFQAAVPAEIVMAHVKALLDTSTGGWYVHEISAVSGMSLSTVQDIAGGVRTGRIFADTWNALRVLEPKGRPRPRTSDMVDGTEVRRTYQGLAAQGFTFEYMAIVMGRNSKSSATRCATCPSRWVTPEKVEEARELRRKLGDYDIATLPEALPGMHPKCAPLAASKGWVPLAAWTDKTIANPDAKPFDFDQADRDPDDLDPLAGLAFIDPTLRHRVLTIAQKIDELRYMRRSDERTAFIDLIGRVTQLEAHVATWTAVNAGMSSTEVGVMLGFSPTDVPERDAGERRVARMRDNLKQAQEWLDSDPHGDTPDWFGNAHRAGRVQMTKILPALIAVQPAPFGAGWSVEELADRCAVPVGEMTDFVLWASREGDRMWARHAPARNRGQRQLVSCSTSTTAYAA